MKWKVWIGAGLVLIASAGAWSAYVVSRRAFLRDFNGGVHAYLAGNYLEAERALRNALERRPRDAEVSQLLTKTLIERSFAQYHQKDFDGAMETLSRASRLNPTDRQTQEALETLRRQFSTPADQRPVQVEQILAGLYKRLPTQNQPGGLQSLMEEYLRRSQSNQEAVFKRFWGNQERWLEQLEREKDEFRKIFFGGLAFFCIAGGALLILMLGMLRAYFGRRGVFARLLEEHYRRLVSALPAGSQALLGPPVSLLQGHESRLLDAIEAEIVSGSKGEDSHQRLQALLEDGDPWVRARAAKILHQLNPHLALEELRRLAADQSADAQVAGLWALAELATPEALDLLAPLAYSPLREIQQGTIRSLLTLQSRETLTPEVRAKVQGLLAEIRSKTGWIF